jgi:hypothetical protein
LLAFRAAAISWPLSDLPSNRQKWSKLPDDVKILVGPVRRCAGKIELQFA